MVSTYELKLEKFSGPLEKLLELIEERKMDITEISMAEVTDDFLKYLKALADQEAGLRLLADFIAVASRLILIKSKFLLPDLTLTGEEEASIKDLEKRLKIYQEFKPALQILAKLWRSKKREFSRPYFLSAGISHGASVFYPGESLDIKVLVESIERLFQSFKGLELETQTIKEKVVSIEEIIEEVMKRMEHIREARFGDLASTKSRMEIIAIFLAILHLAREQLVFLEQSEHFGDIKITNKQS